MGILSVTEKDNLFLIKIRTKIFKYDSFVHKSLIIKPISLDPVFSRNQDLSL